MEITDSAFQPDYAIVPGATLQEMLDDRGMTQTELARRLGVTLKHVNAVVKGAAAISADFALGLEKVIGPSADFWLSREGHYRASIARNEEASTFGSPDAIRWAKGFPVRELQAAGYIAKDARGAALVRSVLQFLGLAEPGLAGTPDVAFRKSTRFDSDLGAIDAWLRVGELQAQRIPCQEYDATTFRAALDRIRRLTPLDPEESYPQIVSLCAASGVALVVVETFKDAKVNGATRWLSPTRALLQLSVRGRWEDIFWFTLYHEAGHILLHPKKSIFLEEKKRPEPATHGRTDEGDAIDTSQGDAEWRRLEAEADAFAVRTLIPQEFDWELATLSSLQDITEFASRIGIAPAIVLGRLQHEGRIPWNRGHHLKRRFEVSID